MARLGSWFRENAAVMLCAIASGLAVALAFPHFDVWPLAWIAWVPVMLVMEDKRFAASFGLALLAGATANLVGFFWMTNMLHQFGHLPFLLSVAIVTGGSFYQALSIALALSLSALLARRHGWHQALVLPVLYTGFEAFHPILFPWFLGNCQYRLLHLIQMCDLFGISALTFVVVLGNAAFFQVVQSIRRKDRRFVMPVVLFAVVLGASLVYGHIRLGQVRAQEEAAPKLKLAVVEPEIGIFEEQATHFPAGESPLDIMKWNLQAVQRASVELALEEPDLIVWPESSYFPTLSVYASRATAEWVAVTRDGIRYVEAGAEIGPLVEGSAGVAAVHSRGSERTWAVGAQGTILSLEGLEVPQSQETPVSGELVAVHVGCDRRYPLERTTIDRCRPVAVGRGGAVAYLEGERWRELDIGVKETLRTISGFDSTTFVAAGDGMVVTFLFPGGEAVSHDTPGLGWVKALTGASQVLLVASDGRLASVTDEGEVTLLEERIDASGEIKDVAPGPHGGLLAAGSRGLLQFSGGQTTVLDKRSVEAVACNDNGRCLTADATGAIFELGVDGLTAIAETGEPVVGLVAVPYTRYYYWIPPDSRRLYQSNMPLPGATDYPAAVFADEETLIRDLNAAQRDFSVPLLFGATSGVLRNFRDPNSLENTRYNSAFLIDEKGLVAGRYDKQYLLAFGEYIPLGDIFPFLYEWSPASGRFEAGPKTEPIDFMGHRLGVLVCYEDIIQSHTNKVASGGANALINLTNDAWFGKTKEPYQHFVLALFRAVEQRLPLVRATSTGISGVVSATGEIRHMTGLYDAETFVTDLPMLESETVYRAWGRHFGLLMLLSALGMLGYSGWATYSRNARRRSST